MMTSYGSLYFASTNLRDAVPVDICADVSPELKDKIKRRFVIGPVAERHFWSKERAEMALDRGPCLLSTHLLIVLTDPLKGNNRRITYSLWPIEKRHGSRNMRPQDLKTTR